MPKYTLTLVDSTALVLKEWIISNDSDSDYADFPFPVRKLGASSLIAEINEVITQREKEKK